MATTGMITVTNSSGSGNTRVLLKEIYNKLKEEMLNDPAFEFNDNSRQWIDRVILSSSSLKFTVTLRCWPDLM